MKKAFTSVILLLISLLSVNSLAVGISFNFANSQVTGNNPKYFEFDVMVAADASGTKIGDTQVYLNYNTAGFGENIADNNKITVTRGSFINNSNYRSPIVSDNTKSRVSIATEFQGSSADDGSELPTNLTQLLHISIEIQDETKTAGLSFQQDLMEGAQFQSDLTQYDPVNADDTNDSSLPVELVSFNVEIGKKGLVLRWTTESEINNLGFEVLRSIAEEGSYQLLTSYLTNPELMGQGNSNIRHEYHYTDKTVGSGNTYWYKLTDVDINGVRTSHGPVSLVVPAKKIPGDFALYPNYPNPFNPSTRLSFDIPKSNRGEVEAHLIVYDILGQVVRVLHEGELSPGNYEINWDGKTEAGQPAPGGVYFAVLNAGSFSKTIKLVLMK